MPLTRKLVPEFLDQLEASDPGAIRARKDLVRVNALMGNARMVAHEIIRICPNPVTKILDLGSGDGLFTLSVARRLAKFMPKVCITTVDRQGLIREQTIRRFERLGWKVHSVSAEVDNFFEHQDHREFDLVITNLFLHHFQNQKLASLLCRASDIAPKFVACEPARTSSALWGSRLLGAIGCNEVTRHDAVASVIAGFRNQELSAHWPREVGWSLRESRAGLFSHLFSAVKGE